jgi:hypothetical protein
MARCIYCAAATEMYVSQVPTCLNCCSERPKEKRKPPAREQQIRAVLVDCLVEATARTSAASQAFNMVMGQFPSGLPHPDGSQQVQKASAALAAARKELMRAHNRLNDYLGRGIVPDDLKQTG